MPSRSSSLGRSPSSARRPLSSVTGRGERNLRVPEPGTTFGRAEPPPAETAAAYAQKRTGAAASRSGIPATARAFSSTPVVPPQSPRRPPASKKASPARSDSTSAPIPSSRCSVSSHARSARSVSGGTSASSGQRDSASPTLIPGRTPSRSAGSLTSPISCAAPGSGASAAGLRSCSARPSSAVRRRKRGASAHATGIERMFVQRRRSVKRSARENV